MNNKCKDNNFKINNAHRKYDNVTIEQTQQTYKLSKLKLRNLKLKNIIKQNSEYIKYSILSSN